MRTFVFKNKICQNTNLKFLHNIYKHSCQINRNIGFFRYSANSADVPMAIPRPKQNESKFFWNGISKHALIRYGFVVGFSYTIPISYRKFFIISQRFRQETAMSFKSYLECAYVLVTKKVDNSLRNR